MYLKEETYEYGVCGTTRVKRLANAKIPEVDICQAFAIEPPINWQRSQTSLPQLIEFGCVAPEGCMVELGVNFCFLQDPHV